MHIAAIITVCFGATLTAGFLLGGFCALLAHDDEDLRRFCEKMAEAEQKGFWQKYLTMRREALRMSQIVAHWRSRSEVRQSIWVGLACAVITLIAAQFI